MVALEALSSLHCELKIMNAKNIQPPNSNGCLFVRCYLSAGNNKRVRLDSRQVSPNGDFSWDESFSLDCIGTNQSMDMIIHGTIILELRWRSNTTLFGGSRLLGRSEISWKGVFESPNMESETWVMMKSKKNVLKSPSVRWRSNTTLFGGSRLLGKSEMSWRNVFESPNKELETWVMMKSKKNVVKSPSVRIAMKIEVPSGVDLVERKRNNRRNESCGCCHGDCCNNNTCFDSELFVIGATLDAF